jgi:hypothetical protein
MALVLGAGCLQSHDDANPWPCHDNSDCESGQKCVKGSGVSSLCRPLSYCEQTSDCAADQKCDYCATSTECFKHCIPGDCSTENAPQCNGFKCWVQERVCYQICETDLSCAPGYTCDSTKGSCIKATK